MVYRRVAASGRVLAASQVGDSITAGALSSSDDHTYPSQLQALLGTGYEVTNLGACGSTLQKKGDSPFWERPQYDTLVNSTWDVVIIMLGTNDAKDAGSFGPPNWQDGQCEDGTLDDCIFADDYKSMIELVNGLGAPEVYLMIPPPLMQIDAYSRRADSPRTGRGDAAAATWIFRGDESRRRRG